MKIRAPNRTDQYVGSRLRMRRKTIGLSQEKLADRIGLTFQQIQKYETGVNRISASRLQLLARVLGVHVSFFFEGGPEARAGGPTKGGDAAPTDFIAAFVNSADGQALAAAFGRIKDATMRRALVRMIEAMVEAYEAEERVPEARSRLSRSEGGL